MQKEKQTKNVITKVAAAGHGLPENSKGLYRLGVSPTGTASMPDNVDRTGRKLSGYHPTYKDCRGFTLIELLVVVLIISILAAIALPQYQKAVEKSRYIQLQTAATAIANAEELYYLSNGFYTDNKENLDVTVPQFASLPVNNNTGHAAVVVSNNKMNHTIYFKHHITASLAGVRYCRVVQDINYLHEICKSLTGKSTGTSCTASGSSNYCMSYSYE